nr:MAG TPA_asm: capsid [Bacteriophage sp.]
MARKGSFKPKTKGEAKSESRTEEGSFDKKLSRSRLGDSTKCAPNDPAWYAANSSLLRDSGSFSFNNPIGNRITLVPTGSGAIPAKTMSIPGVYAIKTAPSIGISVDNSSPVNIAARNIYSFVRHANSGHSNYDAPDLMLYLLAMDQLYSALAFMSRAYGVMSYYSQANRYLPKALMYAMGLDYDDFMAQLADFRYFINSSAVKVGSMCVPKSMSYFARHMWMYSNVYKDSAAWKSGLYLYTPYSFWQYAPIASSQGGSLVQVLVKGADSSGLMTFAELRAMMTNMMNAIILDEDSNIMSGDILKAFTADGVFKIGPISEDYTVEPVHNVEVLGQINNATLVGESLTNNTVTQSMTGATAGALLFNPGVATDTYTTTYVGMDTLFNCFTDMPTPEEVMVNSRLTIQPLGDGAGTAHFTSTGSDIALFGQIFTFVADDNNKWDVVTPAYATKVVKYPFYDAASIDLESFANITGQQECFDWHPQVIPVMGAVNDSGAVTSGSILWPQIDLDNYTMMNARDLEKMHETALLSQFAVPQMGTWNDKLA